MSKIGKFFSKSWLYITMGLILIVYLYNELYAILSTAIILIIYLTSYLVSLSFKKKLIRSMAEYSLLSDDEIARKMKRPVDEIRNILFSLSRNQKRKKWLIVFINKRYVFYNGDTIEQFIELYSSGFNEKQILQNLQKSVRIRTRAEIKAIETTLMSQKRLKE